MLLNRLVGQSKLQKTILKSKNKLMIKYMSNLKFASAFTDARNAYILNYF